jgi:hypothetical protein
MIYKELVSRFRRIYKPPDYDAACLSVYVGMDVRPARALTVGRILFMFSFQEFIRHRAMRNESEHSSSKKGGAFQFGPKI